MRLELLAGAGYLGPREVAPAVLADAVHAFASSPHVPRIGWHTAPVRTADGLAVPPTCYVSWLDDAGPDDVDRRTALLLDYLRDTTRADDTVFLALPYDHADARAVRLLDRATAALGATAVTCRVLALSERSEAVLAALRTGTGAPASIAATPTYVTHPALRAAMHRNFTHAVLSLGEQLVGRASPYAADARAAALTELLDAAARSVRVDVDADAVMAELAPGGELFALLTLPLTFTPPPLTLTTSRVLA